VSVPEHEAQRHAILTCYDDRIDDVVAREIKRYRDEGILLREKDIMRPPGGVHLLAGKTDCRKTFYEALTSLLDHANTTVFHLWPHTNCRYCGKHFQEKLGNGSKSDLRFHVRSAEKMLHGAKEHFSHSSTNRIPELDVRIILTVDQRLVTIDEAHDLLPHVSEHSHHGSPLIHHGLAPGYQMDQLDSGMSLS